MTSNDLQTTPNGHGGGLAVPSDNIGQATAIEQARAIAEVQGAIVVAQRCPRSVTNALAMMRESCAQMGLAERAFFRYSRAGSQITGSSVYLARELARCWGNVQYGITELSRDDEKRESQILAFAWDVQTNTRSTTTFIVKHGRDTKDGIKELTDLRSVYENNANMGARRVREMIFAILPEWFTREAEDRCRATIERGDSEKPLSVRVADLLRAFAELGVSNDQLEQKIGRAQDRWTAHDIVTLTVVGRSIRNGEVTVDDEFPPQRVTVDEIAQQTTQSKPAPNRQSAPDTQRTTAGPTAEEIAEHEAALVAEAERDRATAEAGSGLFGGDS